MNLSVKKTLTLHATIVLTLLTIPAFILHYVIKQSENELDKIDSINSNVLLQLVTVDSALKNARFHSYAGFMHDQNLSVSHYHTHPFELHLETVKKEVNLALNSWDIIFRNTSTNAPYYSDLKKLKTKFDQYIAVAGQPLINALETHNWDAIVQIVTAAIPQYSNYSMSGIKTVNNIKELARAEYQSSIDSLEAVKHGVTTVIIFLIAIYIGFSYWLQRRITQPLTDNIKISEKIASGDLTPNPITNRHDEFGRLAISIETMRSELSLLISEIKIESDVVQKLSATLEASSAKTARSIGEQMHGLTNSASILEELSVNIENIAENSKSSNNKAIETQSLSIDSFSSVERTEKGISDVNNLLHSTSEQVQSLSNQVDEISGITGVIQDVASQTNLLALNAAIEAARAGEQGRGFAVVADEVRNLAATTTQSVEQISQMISNIQLNANETVKSILNSRDNSAQVVSITKVTKDSIKQIRGSAVLVQESVEQVTHALNEQEIAANELAASIEQIAELSRRNNDAIALVEKASIDMSETSTHLKQSVSKFNL